MNGDQRPDATELGAPVCEHDWRIPPHTEHYCDAGASIGIVCIKCGAKSRKRTRDFAAEARYAARPEGWPRA